MPPQELPDDTDVLGDSFLFGAAASRQRVLGAQGLFGSAVAPYRADQRIANFRLIRILGSGGQGSVWEAEDQELRRHVALKLVHPDRIDQRTLQYFAREARAGGRLQHPDIVATYAHGEADGVAWIAQELVVDAQTLADVVTSVREESELPSGYYRRIAAFVARIADALHAAHAEGVIHRDVKPGNILVTAEDRPKLTDFGLARVSDETGLSQTGQVAGTVLYMSPEQIRGIPSQIDHRTDVFSLGVVLYELLTLQRPFEGDTVPQICERIQLEEPVDPVERRSRCPRDLATICQKALAKLPTRRYASAAELASDLRRFLHHEPILARPTGRMERARMWVRRRPVLAASALVGLLASTVIAWLGIQNVMTRARFSPLEDQLLLARLERQVDHLVPIREELIPAIDAWLDDAETLRRNWLEYRATERELLAGVGDGQQRSADAQWALWNPVAEDLANLDGLLRELKAAGAPQELLDEGSIRARLETMQGLSQLRGTESRVGFVASMDAFFEGNKIGRMRARRELCRSVPGTASDPDSIAWAEASQAIAASTRYGGLTLSPQRGLIPLREDPNSGLWEFVVHGSGAAPQAHPSTGRWVVTGDTGIILTLIPGGVFEMGVDPNDPATLSARLAADPASAPRGLDLRRVGPIAPFFIGKHEISQGQWLRLTGDAPAYYSLEYAGDGAATLPADRWALPVELVDWDQSRAGLAVVGLDLPTEAQWEYATRAGTRTWWWFGNAIEHYPEAVNVADQSFKGVLDNPKWSYIAVSDGHALTAPIDYGAANPFGLHGTVGNVYEWCLDAYETQVFTEAADGTKPHVSFAALPMQPDDGRRQLVGGDYRVVRSGAYRQNEDEAGSAFRAVRRRSYLANMNGLRAARAIDV